MTNYTGRISIKCSPSEAETLDDFLSSRKAFDDYIYGVHGTFLNSRDGDLQILNDAYQDWYHIEYVAQAEAIYMVAANILNSLEATMPEDFEGEIVEITVKKG